MGKENPEALPWAELWMGTHHDGPSGVKLQFRTSNLDKIIRKNPQYYLGKQGAQQFGGLPFLLKLLAADSPLSIQAHPSLVQAQEGFQRENRAGLAPDNP